MPVANCTFLATSDQSLLQAAALVRLRDQGFVDDVEPPHRAAHILAHQIMSLAIQMGGVGRFDWWQWLEGAAPFRDLSSIERDAVVEHMLEKDILRDDSGRLWLGEKGEKLYGRAGFRALYAVFESPRMMTVRHATQEIGTIDSSFLASLQEPGVLGAFALGGRTWEVLDIDWSRGRCTVKPAEVGRSPRWSGGPRHLGYELCQAMRGVLVDDDDDPRWSARACKTIAGLRAEHAFLRDGDDLIEKGRSEITWHNFAGGAANVLLARILERELGGHVISRNTSLSFTKEAAESKVAVRNALAKLGDDGRPSWRDALRFAPDATQTRVSKFLPCLPDDQARALLVEKLVDLTTARRLVGLGPLLPGDIVDVKAVQPRRPVIAIVDVAALNALCSALMRERFIALDVETTLTDKRLCLVQIGTGAASYIIDPLVISDLSQLAAPLSSADVVKVIHNAAFERSVLGELGFTIDNVYDTLTESRRRLGQLGGGHSLLAVARRELDVALDKGSQLSDWTQRPLSDAQLAYAALDVEVLIDLYEVFEPAHGAADTA